MCKLLLFSNVLYISFLFAQLVAITKLPEFVERCENNENLSDCSRQELEKLRPYLAKGIPELDLPPLHNFQTPSIENIERNSSIANYNSTFTNIIWKGVENYKILDILINLNYYVLRLNLNFPNLHFSTDVFLEGTILGFNVNGTGAMSINYTNAALDIIMNGEVFNENNNEFISWRRENIEINYDDVSITNMIDFFEESTYTELFRMSLNKASGLLGSSFRVPLDDSLGRFIVNITNRIHKTFPKDVLYPPSHVD